MKNQTYHHQQRINGYAGLGDYAAIGDGRSVALIAPDGAIDWWCAPNMDSPALFDRILDAKKGGYFQIAPEGEYRTERRYRDNSNVLETCFKTATGEVRITESLNSTFAGRLPWCELARRVEGVKGNVTLKLCFVPGTASCTRAAWIAPSRLGDVLHIGDLMAMLRTPDDMECSIKDDQMIEGTFCVSEGERTLVALLVSQKEPLAVPSMESIDERIENSDHAWRHWTESLTYQGEFKTHVNRSALALKFLLYSPTGALAAAPTTSLPEGIGGIKNYDYRYAWIRDACLIIRAFAFIGALAECKAAFSWLTATILRHEGALRACYTLDGDIVPDEKFLPLEGYMGSQPVRLGNNAQSQQQLSMYGDMLETAFLFVNAGHVLDLTTSRLLAKLANECADLWRQDDSGIWELHERRHYTHSKIACWITLDIAIRLAEEGHIETTWQHRWEREKTRISDWVETHCWSEEKQAYTFYAGTDKLDAALGLVWYYGLKINPERMKSTYDAMVKELGHGTPMLYRYSDVEREESTFVACSFWLVEAWARLGDRQKARGYMNQILETLCHKGNVETFNEMFDVRTGEWRGNVPQGLSHLALICAADGIAGNRFWVKEDE
ncbi:glycoside hydrolase family 15 protein [Atlantibacter hermannii]|uniref:glycoside hydrolase family 15 protein n=1 Tax=Atlantibacter hermannii TaxID=565 RepID=UPI00193135AA|nr:glycoside hydrolase family 15 protein [Atlantibacter hermannii]MBL7635539.1 glycoside hydrolase family 15 protein [Atlantibacter hermannii]MBL7676968.1 glycoside hydrolase family 15 protein [Atlantibacter hermannii]